MPSSFDLQFQQSGAEALPVRVEGERGGYAARQRTLAHELQRMQVGQLESAHFAESDPGQMLPHCAGRHLLAQEQKVLRTIGDDGEDRRIALVAGAAVRELVQLASHGLLSKRVSCGIARSRGMKQETMPTCSWTYLRAPPPPAGPLV